MKEKVKEMQSQLEKLATEFYNESGAKTLNIEIRITPWETTHKIWLEFADGYDNKRPRPKTRSVVTIKTPTLCQRRLNFTTRPD